MAGLEVLWAEYRSGHSYLSTLVRDIVGLISPYVRPSLCDLQAERVVETLTRPYPEAIQYLARTGPGEFVYIKQGTLCKISVPVDTQTSYYGEGSLNVCGEEMVYQKRGQYFALNYRTMQVSLLGQSSWRANKQSPGLLIAMNKTHLILKRDREGIFLADLKTSREMKIEPGHQLLALSDTHLLCGEGRKIYAINLETHQIEYRFDQPERFNRTNLVCIDQIVMTVFEGEALLYYLPTGQLLRRFSLLTNDRDKFYLYQRDGRYYIVGTQVETYHNPEFGSTHRQITYYFYE